MDHLFPGIGLSGQLLTVNKMDIHY